MDEDLFVMDTTGDVESKSGVKRSHESSDNHEVKKSKINEIIMYRTDESIVLGDEANPEGETKVDTTQRPKRFLFPRHLNKRYHKVEDNDEKFQPGILSESLRNALGLRSHQLPLHIYRMRQLGYPPGWLRKAEKQNSGMSIINDSSEVETSLEVKVEYDLEKLVTFPGFNVASPDPHCMDEWQALGSSPMQRHQHLDLFRVQLTGQPAHRTDYEEAKNGHEKSNLLEVEDVQASLSDLEEVRRRLLEELDDEGEPVIVEGVDDSNGEASPSIAQDSLAEEEEQKSADNSLFRTPETPINRQKRTTLDIHSTPSSTEVAVPLGTSTQSDLGSPVLRAQTSMKVPSFDKFSQGISPHRPYENLPGATGTFKRVSEVLNRNQGVLRRQNSNLSNHSSDSASSASTSKP